MALDVLPLSDALGAEISGVDLAGRLGVDEIGQIRGAVLRHKVILFRRQALSSDDHLRFARLFGDLQVVRSATHLVGEDQYVMHVANRPVDGKPGILADGEMQFHSDQCYYERPCKATTLHALEVPSKGGNTYFLNMEMAYEALPGAEKSRLEGLDVPNLYDCQGNPTVKGADVDPDARSTTTGRACFRASPGPPSSSAPNCANAPSPTSSTAAGNDEPGCADATTSPSATSST